MVVGWCSMWLVGVPLCLVGVGGVWLVLVVFGWCFFHVLSLMFGWSLMVFAWCFFHVLSFTFDVCCFMVDAFCFIHVSWLIDLSLSLSLSLLRFDPLFFFATDSRIAIDPKKWPWFQRLVRFGHGSISNV